MRVVRQVKEHMLSHLVLFSERCAIDHPQQTIYQILALANAYVDDTTASNRTAKSSRVLGASMLIDRLKKNEKTMLVVSQMSEMCKGKIWKDCCWQCNV